MEVPVVELPVRMSKSSGVYVVYCSAAHVVASRRGSLSEAGKGNGNLFECILSARVLALVGVEFQCQLSVTLLDIAVGDALALGEVEEQGLVVVLRLQHADHDGRNLGRNSDLRS